MTRSRPVRRAVLLPLAALLALLLTGLAGCSVAREANRTRPSPTPMPLAAPTVIAPPQARGLDGTAGLPPPNTCTAIAGPLTGQLGVPVTARPHTWNDGGLPALDLCTLIVDGRPVEVGVSALPGQPSSLDRLAAGVAPNRLPELSVEARTGPSAVVFDAGDRAARITAPGRLDQTQALTLARAVRNVVPGVLKAARLSDGTCQPSGAAAEQFLGAMPQLRRDYRVDGAVTCIWGTFEATVSIVESFRPDTIPEAQGTPAAKRAPIGRPGYYLPEDGTLVFRQGRRVVRVSALADPARPVPLETLLDLVEPLMPLFLR